jgi:N-acetylneuraminic acid mutarotase
MPHRCCVARHKILGLLAFVAIALTGCGGGGAGGSGGAGGGGAPVITTQPTSQSASVYGAAVIFTVAATGNGTLSYQWYQSCGCGGFGTPIAGATSASLTISPVMAIDAQQYQCVVTNTLNGQSATAISSQATLTVLGRNPASLSGAGAVLAGSSGNVVSTGAQAGATYTWTITNGTITAGQGTDQITYTAGPVGQSVITVTVPSPTGTGIAVQNVNVVASFPIVSVFAPSSVLVGSSGILASTTPATGDTYQWTLTNGTASGSITSGQTADALTYAVGASTGTYQLGVIVTDTPSQASAVQTLNVVENTFVSDARDTGPRVLHTATLLTDGRVLIAGGDQGVPNLTPTIAANTPVAGTYSQITATAEVFDPTTSTFSFVGSLLTARFEHTATLLNDGRVLVVGGGNSNAVALSSTEIYDPATQSWSAGPALATARALHTAALLSDGRVLVAGGVSAGGALVGTAEVYDPLVNSWSAAGTLVTPLAWQSAILLPSGQVLVASGASAELYNPGTNSWAATASSGLQTEGPSTVALASGQVLQVGLNGSAIYDPTTATWSDAALPMTLSSVGGGQPYAADATLLPDGRVLATGGQSGGGSSTYDPITQIWTIGGVATAPFSTATSLANGEVLVLGGLGGGSGGPSEASSYWTAVNTMLLDPTANAWTVLSSGTHSGAIAASVVLQNGAVLVSGGYTEVNPDYPINATTSADLYTSTTNTWSPAAPMATARSWHTATGLTDGTVLVTGGIGGCSEGCSGPALASAERYSPTANTWTSAGSMLNPRYQHTASLLSNGQVLVAGGSNATIASCNCTTFLAAAELYESVAGTWTSTGSLNTARYAHTATVLANGEVLVAGGFGGTPNTQQNVGSVLATAELYDPTTGVWTVVASMNTARSYHTATLLPSGQVLVVGGNDGTVTTPTAEIYDPTANTWTTVASLLTPRQSQSAALLPSGNVLVVGGYNTASSAVFGVGTAELYNPTANTFSAAGSMVTLRQGFNLSLLGDGRVMLVGGLPNLAGLAEFYR